MAARRRALGESKMLKDLREAEEELKMLKDLRDAEEELKGLKMLKDRKDREAKLALSEKALTRPKPELQSAGPAASNMEFVLTSTTPGASGKKLVSSAEEISRIALEFATKVEDLKILWDVLSTSPEEASAEFIKAVEVMKQMLQHVERQFRIPCLHVLRPWRQCSRSSASLLMSSCLHVPRLWRQCRWSSASRLASSAWAMAGRLWCQSRSTQLALPLFLWGLFPGR